MMGALADNRRYDYVCTMLMINNDNDNNATIETHKQTHTQHDLKLNTHFGYKS